MEDSSKTKEQLITEVAALRQRITFLETSGNVLPDASCRETQLLLRAATAITETLSLDERLNRILTQLEQVMAYESASVQLLRADTLEIVSVRGWATPAAVIGMCFPFPGDNPNTEVIQKRRPLFLKSPAEKYKIFTNKLFSHIKSWLGIPLIVRGNVIGLLAFDNLVADNIAADQMHLVNSFAKQVAIAIENAQLFRNARQQADRLNQILDISALLHRGLDLETVLEEIAKGALKLGFRAALMNIYDAEQDLVTIPVMVGVPDNERKILESATYSWTRDIQTLMQEKFRVSRSYMIPHEKFDWETEYQAVSIPSPIEYRGYGYWHPNDALIVPMWDTKGNPLGVLWVDEPVDDRIPDLETIRLLEALADQGAIAIENARLHKQIRQDAETKAMLLREVNHRVQNNLASIISMIYIERTRQKLKNRPDYQAIMQSLINRIQGLATVHRMLSGTKWSPLLLSDLTQKIIDLVVQALPSNKQLAVDVSPASVFVGSKYANNLVLIINELATNTVKYALNERSSGRIAVKFRDEGDMIFLEYRDDGPGYPPEVLQSDRYNVGLQLIKNIIKNNLAGELSLHNDGGAVTTIRFAPDAQIKVARAKN